MPTFRRSSNALIKAIKNIEIPDSVTDILRLGKGFSSMALNCRSKQVVEIIKDVEDNIDKLPRSDQQDFRSKVLHLSKKKIFDRLDKGVGWTPKRWHLYYCKFIK